MRARWLALTVVLGLLAVPAVGSADPPAGGGEPIRLGVITDLSGPFASLGPLVVDGQQAYFDRINAKGGIDGHMIELIVRDGAYDVPTHVGQYNNIRDDVDALALSLGGPTTEAIVPMLEADDTFAITLSSESSWMDVDNVLSLHASYCAEAINAVGTLMSPDETVAIVRFAGSGYGLDAATGVQAAALAAGVEVVLDRQFLPRLLGGDPSAVAAELAALGADWVYVAADPYSLYEMMIVSEVSGYHARWTGASPTWTPFLLGLGDYGAHVLEARYTVSTPIALWGDDVKGMKQLTDGISEAFPNTAPSDAHVLGWAQAEAMTRILKAASKAGDLSPAGILAAAQTANLKFKGIAPEQTLGSDTAMAKATAFHAPSLEAWQAASGADTSYEHLLGTEPLHPFGVSDLASTIDIDVACLAP